MSEEKTLREILDATIGKLPERSTLTGKATKWCLVVRRDQLESELIGLIRAKRRAEREWCAKWLAKVADLPTTADSLLRAQPDDVSEEA